MISTQLHTAEQLLQDQSLGRCELIRGELNMMSPAGPRHGLIAMRVGALLHGFVKQRKLGEIFAAETGFVLSRNPDTVRAPDAAFVRIDRMHLMPQRGFFPGAPDLAVEVLSPDDAAGYLLAKADEWLNAGVKSLWVVDPERRTVAIYRPDQAVQTFGADEMLIERDLLPGLKFKVNKLFD